MTPSRMPPAVALCVAALLAAAPLAATATDAAARTPTSPDQPKPRTGDYKIMSQGDEMIHAKCVEGGHVFVGTHAKDTAAQRDRAIRDACKTTDFTK